MPDDRTRDLEQLRQYYEHRLQTTLAIAAVQDRQALLEAIRSLKDAGMHEQAERLEKQVNVEPVRLALPAPSTNGVAPHPPALPELPAPAPAPKKRGRPPKQHEQPSSESEPSSE